MPMSEKKDRSPEEMKRLAQMWAEAETDLQTLRPLEDGFISHQPNRRLDKTQTV